MEERANHPEVTAQVVLALDAEGGDNAPAETVAGAVLAASPALKVLLVGRPESITPHLRDVDAAYVEIVPSGSVVGPGQEPTAAVRSMPDSSIVVGARTVADGRSQGFVSAGSTGAMVAASVLIMRRAPGVKRPAVLTVLPGISGPVVFLDAGANADCRPGHLLEFGVLGVAYARAVLGIAEPSVGLLNIGEEEGKGNELAQAAHRLLRGSPLRFIGNVEGRDMLTGGADVVVTDGFTGNVALKVLEGCASSMFVRLKSAATSGARAKMGGALLRPALRGMRADLDPESHGGTYLLGVRGLSVICHGNASRRAIANALQFGADALRRGVLEAVDREVALMTGVGAGSAECRRPLIQ